MTNKLKKCPFCGSDGMIASVKHKSIQGYTIGCINSKCILGFELIEGTVIGKLFWATGKKQDAIKKWNTRKSDG